MIDIDVPEDLARARAEVRARRGAVFFDRDGVINEDRGYVHRVEDFAWMPEAREAVKLVNDRGFYAFIVTNQAGIARGYYGEERVRTLHSWMNAQLRKVGAHIDEFRYCPYHPDAIVPEYRQDTDYRKPAAGMIRDLMTEWDVDPARSVLIGDKETDLAAARSAGICGYLYRGGSLLETVRRLLPPPSTAE